MSKHYPSIYLIQPEVPDSHSGFKGMQNLFHKKWMYMPLALPTIAALTPSEYRVVACDENVEPIDLDTDCEIIGISCINVQERRAFEIADEFRRRGKFVVLGGNLPTALGPEETLKHADVVFIGEAELTWPQFLEDYRHHKHKRVYENVETVDMARSPIPRFEILKLDQYLIHSLQTTRGCPFACEFCDVPKLNGHTPRTKTAAQAVEEVRLLEAAGARHIFLCNDNFIGNKKHAKEVMQALIDYRKQSGSRVSFTTEVDIRVAADDELLNLLHDSNFNSVFIGIESSRISSLKETHKFHNAARPLLEDVRKVQSYGISVVAGMIMGFDNDDINIFCEHFNFLMEASIPLASLSILQALPNTPLWDRMKREGRLLDDPDRHAMATQIQHMNIVPKQLTPEQLVEGHKWLWKILFRYDNYAKRIINCAKLQGRLKPPLKLNFKESVEVLLLFFLCLNYYLFTFDRSKRTFFRQIFKGVLSMKFSMVKLREVLVAVWYHRFMYEVINRIYKYGDPQEVPDYPEFQTPIQAIAV